MNQIFTYDDASPIAFYVDIQQGNLGQHIVRHGGILASAFQARIHIGYRDGAVTLPMKPDVPMLRPAWVTESIEAGRMVPVYPYSEDPAQDLLQNLAVEHRDIAELLKGKVGNSGNNVFAGLHRKFPHNSTQVWRALYESSEVVIQLALARIIPVYQEQLNKLILPFFPQPVHPIPARQRFPGDVEMVDRNHMPRADAEPPNDNMAEANHPLGVVNPRNEPRAASDASSQAPSDTTASTPLRRKQARPDFITDNNEEGEEEKIIDDEDDDDDDYTDHGDVSPSETPGRRYQPRPKGARIGRGLRLTDLDYERMAQFVNSLGRDPGLQDWVDFWNMDPINQTRSFSAWNIQYYMKKAEIAAARARLRTREIQTWAHNNQ